MMELLILLVAVVGILLLGYIAGRVLGAMALDDDVTERLASRDQERVEARLARYVGGAAR